MAEWSLAMSTDSEHFAIDRIDGSTAVLVDDAGQTVKVSLQELPDGAHPGSVISAMRNESGEIEWDSAELDEEETESRLAKARSIIDELRKRDPGGDIAL